MSSCCRRAFLRYPPKDCRDRHRRGQIELRPVGINRRRSKPAGFGGKPQMRACLVPCCGTIAGLVSVGAFALIDLNSPGSAETCFPGARKRRERANSPDKAGFIAASAQMLAIRASSPNILRQLTVRANYLYQSSYADSYGLRHRHGVSAR